MRDVSDSAAGALFDGGALIKLQAKWKGRRTREGEYARAKAGAAIICPHLASPPSVIEAVLDLAKDELGPSSLFYDLGCGDGTVVLGIAKATSCDCVGIDIDPTLCATARRRAAEAGGGVAERVLVRQLDLASLTTLAGAPCPPTTTDSHALCSPYTASASASASGNGNGSGNRAPAPATVTAAAVSGSEATRVPRVIFIFLVPSCLAVLSVGLLRTLARGTMLLLYKFPLPVADGWVPTEKRTVDDAVKPGTQAQVFLYRVTG